MRMSLVHCILLFACFSWDACVACAGPEAGKTCEAGWPYRGLYITPRVPTRAFFGTTPKPRSVLPILRYMGLDTNQTPLGAPAHPRASRSVLLGLRESEGHARVARFQGESPVDPLVLIAASPARPALVLFVDLQHARPKLGVCSLYGPSVFNTTHATASAPYHESALLQDLADLRNSLRWDRIGGTLDTGRRRKRAAARMAAAVGGMARGGGQGRWPEKAWRWWWWWWCVCVCVRVWNGGGGGMVTMQTYAFVDAFEKVEIVRLTITAALGVDALDALLRGSASERASGDRCSSAAAAAVGRAGGSPVDGPLSLRWWYPAPAWRMQAGRVAVAVAVAVAHRVVGEGRGACAGLARLLDLRQLAYGILLVGL